MQVQQNELAKASKYKLPNGYVFGSLTLPKNSNANLSSNVKSNSAKSVSTNTSISNATTSNGWGSDAQTNNRHALDTFNQNVQAKQALNSASVVDLNSISNGASSYGNSASTFSNLNDLWDKANGYKSQIDALLKQGFTYDPKTDPAYQSIEQLAQKNAKVASKGAMETMNDRGILNSTVTNDRLGQIEQTAQDAVTAQVPSLRNAAYGKYMDKLNALNGLYSQTVQQAQWKDSFDYNMSQDSINNDFKSSQLELDRLNYDLSSVKQLQDAGTYKTDAQATNSALAELMQFDDGDKALSFMQSKLDNYASTGVNISTLVSNLNKRWPGFNDKVSNSSVNFSQ
jgi:hypothetical protein